MSHTHEEIAPLANSLWETQGRPNGKADEHWHMAEAHLNFNRQAEAAGEKSELLSEAPPVRLQTVKRYRLSILDQLPEVIEALSVDEADPVRIRFACVNGSTRSYGRGLLLSYEQCGDHEPLGVAGPVRTA